MSQLSIEVLNIQEILNNYHDVVVNQTSGTSLDVAAKSVSMSEAGTDYLIFGSTTTVNINN